jgi:uncharacterized surface protein with fasciclin (FAS1) repeats
MTRSVPKKLGALTLAAVMTLAACGSDGEDTSSPAETTEAAAEVGTIVDVAAGNPDFETLVAAVTAAELGETLSGEGPFTVFAPTNDAFAALPEGTLDTLLEPANKDQLAGILTYHVVSGAVMAADLSDGQVVETVNGATLTVSIDGDSVTLTDAAGGTVNVVATDVEASNGVIHVIDGVLLPSA